MIKNKIKGCIVNITSQLGHIGAYNRSIYCMSKFGLEDLINRLLWICQTWNKIVSVAPTKTIVNQSERKRKKKG